MSFGAVTPELHDWLIVHADPAYKPWRFPSKRKESVRKFSRTAVADDMSMYEYSLGLITVLCVNLCRFHVLLS